MPSGSVPPPPCPEGGEGVVRSIVVSIMAATAGVEVEVDPDPEFEATTAPDPPLEQLKIQIIQMIKYLLNFGWYNKLKKKSKLFEARATCTEIWFYLGV